MQILIAVQLAMSTDRGGDRHDAAIADATQPKLILVSRVCRSVMFWLVAGMIAAYDRQWRG
jgi:hypothetical protein